MLERANDSLRRKAFSNYGTVDPGLQNVDSNRGGIGVTMMTRPLFVNDTEYNRGLRSVILVQLHKPSPRELLRTTPR